MISCDGFGLQVHGMNASRPCLPHLSDGEKARVQEDGRSTCWLFLKLAAVNGAGLYSPEAIREVDFDAARAYTTRPIAASDALTAKQAQALPVASRSYSQLNRMGSSQCSLTARRACWSKHKREKGTYGWQNMDGTKRDKSTTFHLRGASPRSNEALTFLLFLQVSPLCRTLPLLLALRLPTPG